MWSLSWFSDLEVIALSLTEETLVNDSESYLFGRLEDYSQDGSRDHSTRLSSEDAMPGQAAMMQMPWLVR